MGTATTREPADGDGGRRAGARRAAGPAGGGAVLEPARGVAPGGADPRGRRRGAVPRQPVHARAASATSTPSEAIDLLLHATAQGLFEMDWLLICPRCACAVESFARCAPSCASSAARSATTSTRRRWTTSSRSTSPSRRRSAPSATTARRRSTRSTTCSTSGRARGRARRTASPTSTRRAPRCAASASWSRAARPASPSTAAPGR